jgi:hypothetical protein
MDEIAGTENHRRSCFWPPVAVAFGLRSPKKRDRVTWDNGISYIHMAGFVEGANAILPPPLGGGPRQLCGVAYSKGPFMLVPRHSGYDSLSEGSG